MTPGRPNRVLRAGHRSLVRTILIALAVLPVLAVVLLPAALWPGVARAGAPPAIAPTTTSVAPMQSQTFTASGGSGMGYAWSLIVNMSGGQIQSTGATTAKYTAGPMGNSVDQVEVTDSNLETATAVVSVTNGVAITPLDPTVGEGEQQQFTATGGKPPYTWKLLVGKSGMPSINGSGLYTAGAMPGVDTIQATDSLGSSATDTITVVAMVALGTDCTTSATCPSAGGAKNCVDGVCCNSACSGQCQACNTAGKVGTCVTISGEPVSSPMTTMRPACPMSDPMNPCSQKICDGTSATACTSFVGASTTCILGACVDMIGTPTSVCDGDGGCPKMQPSSCAPYACVGGSCTASCTNTADCSPGYYCDVTSQMCVSADASIGEGDGGVSEGGGGSSSSGCGVGGMAPSDAGALGVLLLALSRLGARLRKRR
jgi:hypothetical protein